MRFEYVGFKEITFEDAVRRINKRRKKFAPVPISRPPFPFTSKSVIGGVMMKDEGWSEKEQKETPPVFWIYLDGKTSVLKISGNDYKKVIAIPKSKQIYRFI